MATQVELGEKPKAEPKRPNLSEGALLALLRERYPAPEYAFLSHVRNSTGFARTTRTADALAFGLWKSRGHYLTGFEIKSSRGDWLRELKDPAKADEIAAYCEMWIVVTGGPDIIRAGELPPKWGHITVDAKGALRTDKAPVLDTENLKPISRGFMAAILRVAHEGAASQVEINTAVETALREREKQQAEWAERDRKRDVSDYAQLKEAVAKFERESGVRIDQWSYGNIGAVVRQIQYQRPLGSYAIENLANQAEAIARELRERAAAFAVLDAPKTEEPTALKQFPEAP